MILFLKTEWLPPMNLLLSAILHLTADTHTYTYIYIGVYIYVWKRKQIIFKKTIVNKFKLVKSINSMTGITVRDQLCVGACVWSR